MTSPPIFVVLEWQVTQFFSSMGAMSELKLGTEAALTRDLTMTPEWKTVQDATITAQAIANLSCLTKSRNFL